MVDERELFQKNCEYQFIQGLDAVLERPERDRVNPAYLDQIFLTGDLTPMDMFLLRAVTFYGVATAEMIVEFLGYHRKFYGMQECSELLQPRVSLNNASGIDFGAELQETLKTVRRRLKRMGDKSLLVTKKIVDQNNSSKKWNLIFCTTANTVSAVKAVFGKTAVFSTGMLTYDMFYQLMPIQDVIEYMHACRVCVLGFMNHGDRAILNCRKELVYGANKDKYTPAVLTEIKTDDREFHILTEAIHFTVDHRYHTETEHLRNIEFMIECMAKIVAHYNYVRHVLKFASKKEIRFLIAVENYASMTRIVNMLGEHADKLRDLLFFTCDTFLAEKKNLRESVFMFRRLPDKLTGKDASVLIRPGEKTLMDTYNEWIL